MLTSLEFFGHMLLTSVVFYFFLVTMTGKEQEVGHEELFP